jgi:peroxiredoxin Q/BCP
MGIERITFIFNDKGKLCHEIRKVKVKGHVDEVLSLVQSL